MVTELLRTDAILRETDHDLPTLAQQFGRDEAYVVQAMAGVAFADDESLGRQGSRSFPSACQL